LLLSLDPLEDLFTVDGDVLRGVDADAHLVALHAEDSGRHIISDHDGLTC
jgi:hypothetical protein